MPAIGEPVARNSAPRALRVRDAAPGIHPVHIARLDRLRRAQRVAVKDLAFEQIRDGGEIDVRMRAHVEALAGCESAPGRTRPRR